jgi:hypothetical protein
MAVLSRRRFAGGALTGIAMIGLPSMTSAGARDPLTAPDVAFDHSGHFSGWLPFSLDASSHLIVSAVANGVATTAIIDSGSGRTLIDVGFARRLKLSSRPGFRAAGVTADAYGDLTDDLVIRLGAYSMVNMEAAILDLSAISTAGGAPVELIIGRDLFERVLVDLDFSESRLGLFSFSVPPKLAGATQIALTSDALGRRYVTMSVDGLENTLACYDLGSDVPLVISPEYANEHKLLAGLKVSSVASAGVSGISLGKVAVLPRVEVAGIKFENVPIQVPSTWNQSEPILAGLPIWSRFNNGIDYSRNRLTLTPAPNAVMAPFPRDRSGIGAARSTGGLRIMHVAEGSPAEVAGLRPGDEIVAIDGLRVDAAYLSSHPRIGARPAGTVFKLTLASGRQVDLVLADYF